MSDRFSAQILIGGNLPKAKVPDFLKALEADGVRHEWGEHYIRAEEGEQALTKSEYGRENGTKVLRFCDEEACYGQFEKVEEFCEKNKLSFDRNSEAYCSYDAETVSFRPGHRDCRFSDQNGNPLVPVSAITRAFGKDCKKVEKMPKDKLVKTLKKLCGLDVPELPEFKIV